jgi:hypothetical protein
MHSNRLIDGDIAKDGARFEIQSDSHSAEDASRRFRERDWGN